MPKNVRAPPAYTILNSSNSSNWRERDTSSRLSADWDTSPSRKTACNYTRVVREWGPVKETFVVDPSIRVNEALLPPLTDAERAAEGRNNLYVKTKSGDIDVNIELEQNELVKTLLDSHPAKVKLVVESTSVTLSSDL